jgi:hypothetical protein
MDPTLFELDDAASPTKLKIKTPVNDQKYGLHSISFYARLKDAYTDYTTWVDPGLDTSI